MRIFSSTEVKKSSRFACATNSTQRLKKCGSATPRRSHLGAGGSQLLTVPVYYSPRSRTLYEFKGYHEVTRDSTTLSDLKERKGPVPLSRIVFLKKL